MKVTHNSLHTLMSAVPPPNFDDWPITRYGALGFLGVVGVALIVCLALPHCRRRFLSPADRKQPGRLALQAVLVGLVVSLWLHFIPCIFWTCDWGASDGQGVRGAIWFGAWGLIAGAYVVASCYCQPSTQAA